MLRAKHSPDAPDAIDGHPVTVLCGSRFTTCTNHAQMCIDCDAQHDPKSDSKFNKLGALTHRYVVVCGLGSMELSMAGFPRAATGR